MVLKQLDLNLWLGLITWLLTSYHRVFLLLGGQFQEWLMKTEVHVVSVFHLCTLALIRIRGASLNTKIYRLYPVSSNCYAVRRRVREVFFSTAVNANEIHKNIYRLWSLHNKFTITIRYYRCFSVQKVYIILCFYCWNMTDVFLSVRYTLIVYFYWSNIAYFRRFASFSSTH